MQYLSLRLGNISPLALYSDINLYLYRKSIRNIVYIYYFCNIFYNLLYKFY